MRKGIYKIVSVIIISLMCLFNVSFADVGNFSDYDSDWGSSFDSGYDYDWDYGYDYGYDDYGYGYSYYGGRFTFEEAFILFIIFVFIAVYCKKHNINLRGTPPENYRRPKNSSIHASETSINSATVLTKIKQVDKFFNEANFLSWAKNLFVKLQNAWTDRNFETIRTFETEELFEQHSNQIRRYIENKQINVMDRIAVNYAKLYSFEQDNDKDTLSIVLNASMVDYIIDEETKDVIQGNKTTRRTSTYLMTFIRKKGVVTAESTDEVKTTNCPNCGAPTTITSSGKCEYCCSVITTGEHDWVLSNLEPFRG